ncbi:ribosomal protein L7/L12 C-terminal domain-containing protein [Lentinula raphanica]|nr:ribosomal protein L7/L12 C-terminal domain-containing protein [Lentinula raphanica]
MAQAIRCSGVFRTICRPASFASSSRTAFPSRHMATAAAATAKSTSSPPPPPAKSSDATINRIVDDISGLTLLQAADLVSLLKSRLNIQELAMPAVSAAPAAAASTATDEPAAEAPKEKTIFTVKLESFDATSKPKVIREVKAMNPTLTLIDAKKFVESLPQVLKENLPKEDAEKMQKAFEALGAVVKLE